MLQQHQQLLDVFKSVDSKQDSEALEQYLEPQDIRDHFYDLLSSVLPNWQALREKLNGLPSV